MADENNKILIDAFKLPPAEAIKFFESKGYKISFNWHEMQRHAHTKAFTVAGVTQMDVLKDIHQSLVKSEKEGMSYSSFKADIVPLLTAKGWYQKKIVNYQGKEKEVDLSAPWRLKLIYNTNMRTSMMAGRYKDMKDIASMRPYWQYVAIKDGNTRPEHLALSGKIFHHSDPFWSTYYPPNGWNCRCRVVSISKSEFERKNFKIDRGDSDENKIDIAPEWAYNPGEKDFIPEVDKYPKELQPRLKEEIKEIRPADNVVLIDKTTETASEAKVGILQEYEKQIVDLDHEEAFVITEKGQIYNVIGQSNDVDISILGKQKLKNAYVTHNHPPEETEFSFSKEDFYLFEIYELALLRGIDYRFIYELTRGRTELDEVELERLAKLVDNELSEEIIHHIRAMMRAKQLGLSLKRFKR